MWNTRKGVFVCEHPYIAPRIIRITNRICCKCHNEYPLTRFVQKLRGKYYFSIVCIYCIRLRRKSSYRKCRNNPNSYLYHQKRVSIHIKSPSKQGQFKRDYEKRWKESNPTKKIACDLRSRIWNTLKGNKKYSHFRELVGCSDDFLKEYLESKFIEGMTWENHGNYGWHIDHIKPCASFDMSNPEEQKKCFHYTNLQPLWWYDNISKGNKII